MDCKYWNCSGLTSVTIPNSVITIGNYAFYGCSSLTSVIIGSRTKTIYSGAFGGCSNLTDVYYYAENVPSMIDYDNNPCTNAFNGSNIGNSTLHVPVSSIEEYSRTKPWSDFGNIVGLNKCETPTITLLAKGIVRVESATEGATCITNITASNAEPLTDGEISLTTPLTVYTVTSYATAEGYEDSDVATATFRYEKAEGDVNGDGVVNISDVIQLVNMILAQ